MAKKTKGKGKQSLLETTDSRDIIETDGKKNYCRY